MLASSAIININNKYNEAIMLKQQGRTSFVTIGNLGKNRLGYIVTNESIELGIKDTTGVLSPLDKTAVDLLRTGYREKQKVVSMIDIAYNLNSHSRLIVEH